MQHRITFAALMTTLALAVAIPAQASAQDLPDWPPCGPIQNVINGNAAPNNLVGGIHERRDQRPGRQRRAVGQHRQRRASTAGFGDDILHGNPGNDCLHGDEGNDKLERRRRQRPAPRRRWAPIRLDGGNGNDRLDGDDGNDQLSGGAGADFLDGGAGWDICDVDGVDVGWVNCEVVF